MLRDRLFGVLGKSISILLIVTTQVMTAHVAYAQDEMAQAVAEANAFAVELRAERQSPTYNNDGELMVNGKPFMSKKEITGQQDNDFLPASYDGSYGSDANTLIAGQNAKAKYDTTTLETSTSSGERAYHILTKSIATQKPDLTNDPMWDNTDHVIENLEEIAKDFANCEVRTELVSTGNSYHVPKYESCERLPAIEDSFIIGHDYDVGVVKVGSGPANLLPCGDGCVKMWAGEVRTSYLWWKNNTCTIYEEKSQVEVLNPSAIYNATVNYSKFDDFYQLHINDTIVYADPVNYFPPEIGACTHDTGDHVRNPNIDVTSFFRDVPENTKVNLNSRVSIFKGGWGYSSILIYYDPNQLIHGEVWTDEDKINTAHKIKTQADDGYCTANITCRDMPTLDASGCATINGIYVCEDDFATNPIKELGISPFCKSVEVESNCAFNEGEICFENMDGVETCYENDTTTRNTCVELEENPECSYVKTECVEGAQGASGDCYVQEDTFDCGFDASTGQEVEEDVLICDGKLQCVGESCYSPSRDIGNDNFGEASAYLEMLRYAQADMSCEGIPDAPYNEDSPPDQYVPVKTCEAGYKYDADNDMCLKEIGCTYSDNDFYAASIRNGIQVVSQNVTIANDASIPVCVAIKNENIAYTCGAAKKKIATDTFHEVCTNNFSNVIPNSCPDSVHSLKPETGYCEVPPTIKCLDGFDLHEGDNSWSNEDDFCRLETPVTYNCDISHENYNPKTGVCEGLLFQGAQCDNPMSLEDDICSATLTDDVECPSGQSFDPITEMCSQMLVNPATCPAGVTLENDRCNKLFVEDAECPSGQSLKDGVCSVTLDHNASCPSGMTLEDDVCSTTLIDDVECPSGQSFDPITEMCSQMLVNPATCPAGVTLENDRCNKLFVEDAECPSGQSLKDGVCSVTLDHNASCNDGYTLINDQCQKVLIETPDCPSGSIIVDGKCSVTSTMPPTCSNGGTLINGQCQTETSEPASKHCLNGTFTDGQCKVVGAAECRPYEQSYSVINGMVFYPSLLKIYWGGSYMSTTNNVENYYSKWTYRNGYEWKAGAHKRGQNYGVCRRELTLTEPVNVCPEGTIPATGNLCKGVTITPVNCQSGYAYNPSTNKCEKTTEILPVCPSGYGYSYTSEKCEKVAIHSPLCQSGYGYNFSTNKCEKVITSAPMCRDGYSFNLSTNKCEKEVDVAPICSSGYNYNPTSNRCEKVVVSDPQCQAGYEYEDKQCEHGVSAPPMCQSGYGYNFSTNKCEKVVTSYPMCRNGYNFNLSTNKCEKEVDVAPICSSGYSYNPTSNRCEKVVVSDPQCQTGYEYADKQCENNVSATPICQNGYAFNTNTDRCEKPTISDPRLSCDTEGTAYHEPTNTCRIDMDAEASCPSLYPVWSEKEARCMSASLSPLGRVEFNPIEHIAADIPVSKQLVEYALSPFEVLFTSLVPTAVAESEPDEQTKVTQASMQKYVGEKLIGVSERVANDQELYAIGRSQLMGYSSSVNPKVTAKAYSAKSSSGGDQNVTCELFKGTAAECKIAVGGMQDCCKNPVPTSLADYVNMGRAVLQLDGYTGEVFGLDGYTGAWDAAADLGSSAYEAVFSSATDTAAQEALTEGAGESLVAELGQQAMQYSYEFLFNNFGAEAAGMLFSSTGATAGAAGTVTGASPALATAGAALMVVYYVYLAYVVFNLLINIVFECTDEEFDLANKRDLLSTHKIGSYCKTKVLGACVEKRNSYCQFDSPLSRIMMEQIYMQPQMGLSWGSAKHPNCTGLSLQAVADVDWGSVNLDEWIGILIKSDAYEDFADIDIDSLTGAGSNLDFTDDSSRENILEKNKKRMEELNGDAVRRVGYEEEWNKQQ